jgi:hypothetical protein
LEVHHPLVCNHLYALFADSDYEVTKRVIVVVERERAVLFTRILAVRELIEFQLYRSEY